MRSFFKWLFAPEYNPAQLLVVFIYLIGRWIHEDWFQVNPGWGMVSMFTYLTAFIVLGPVTKRYWTVTPKEKS